MQPHQEEDEGDEIVAPCADVAHHPTKRGRDHADERDGDKDATREDRGQPERPARCDLPLLIDEADYQRNARQVAGAEDDTQDAPDERGAKRDARGPLDRLSEGGEDLLHAHSTPTSASSLRIAS